MKYAIKYKPKIFSSIAVFLQTVALRAGQGYHHFIDGEIDDDKVEMLTIKFHEKYYCCADSAQKNKNKKNGVAGTFLIFYKNENQQKTYWLLLVASGINTDKSKGIFTEQQVKPLKQLQIRAYEIRKYWRADQQKHAWSWQLTTKAYDKYLTRIKSAQHSKVKMQQVLDIIRKIPGFHLLREQKKNLSQTAYAIRNCDFKTELEIPPMLFIGQFLSSKSTKTVSLDRPSKQRLARSIKLIEQY